MPKKSHKPGTGCLLFLIAMLLLVAWAFSEKLHTVTYQIASAKITSPMRLVLLSDLHSSSYGKKQSALLAAIEKASPDFVCLVGDIFDDEASHQPTLDLFDGLADTYPCYFVTGNHEHWSDEGVVLKALLTSYGVTVLAGDVADITIGSQTIRIGGIDDPTGFVSQGEHGTPDKDTWYGQLTMTENLVMESASHLFSILLSHRPELVDVYRESPFDLVLTGHAHGGQVRLPFLPNGIFSPGEGYYPHYTGGVHQLGDTTLVISRGLCKNELPRVFNPPELVVIDLVPVEN